MTTTKKDFRKFVSLMIKDSKTLYRHQAKHNSVYFAGYALEGYIKIILIHHKTSDFIGHLGDSDFLNKFKRLIALYPNDFNDSILKQTSSQYPKYLLDGNGNNTTKTRWNINSRYQVQHWTDRNFAQRVNDELTYIEQALNDLRMDGVL